MRIIAAALACFAAIGPVSIAAQRTDQPRVVHLRGYFVLDYYPTWRSSDGSPWYLLSNAPWADKRLVKWGYVPAEHDGKRFYCLIDHHPRTGTRIPGRNYMCGDPTTAESLYNNNWAPVLPLYGPN